MLPPERRLGEMMRLIELGLYFTLHAGRQTGKTTSVQWLVEHYNAGERFRAMWPDNQTAREQPDPKIGFRTILNNLDMAVERDLPDLGPPADPERLDADPVVALFAFSDVLDRVVSAPDPLQPHTEPLHRGLGARKEEQ